MEGVAAQVSEFIASEFVRDGAPLTADTDLLGQEIIDSLGLFRLLGFIEDRFSVGIDAEEVVPDNFRSVSAIEQLISGKLAG